MNNRPASIKKNYLYNLSYQMLTMVVPLITTPYIARVLGADGVGAYSYTTSIVTYFNLFGAMGIATYGQKCIAESRDNPQKVTETFYELMIFRFCTLALSLVGYAAILLINNTYHTAFVILSLSIIAEACDISWFFSGLERFDRIVLRNIAVKLLCVCGIFAFVKQKSDLYLYIFLMTMSVLLGNLSLWLYLPKMLVQLSKKSIQPFRHWNGTILYFIPTIATTIYNVLDKTMLHMIVQSDYENGYYEQAYKIVSMGVTVLVALNTVVRPRMAYLFAHQKYAEITDKIHKSIQFVLLLSFPMSCGLIAIAPNLVPWFLGDGYGRVILIIQVLSLIIVLIGISNCIGTHYLTPSGNQTKSNVALCMGAAINFCLNLYFIRKWGAVGATITSLIAELVIVLFYLWYAKEYVTLDYLVQYGWKKVTASIIMLAAVKSMSQVFRPSFFHSSILAFVGASIYFCLLWIMRDEVLMMVFEKIKQKLKRMKN